MATASDGEASSEMGKHLLQLPDCMIEQVLEYLSYDEIAKKRIVCRKFDRICQSLLNRGWIKMIRLHNTYLKAIKAQLPRRESERRNHPLAKHSDILTCVETRISMLSMTYSKYIDKDLCCFIPGKVIDEVLNILRIVENTSRPLRAHEVLQELRDISSMAIEHFDENIAQRMKKILCVHHPQHPSHPFHAAGFFQNENFLTVSFCPDVNGDKTYAFPTSSAVSTALPPISTTLPTCAVAGPSTSGAPMGSVYCQSGFSASGESKASIATITNKTRKMRNDINRIDHTISGFKAEMRSMRMQMMRHNTEIKDLRRRLEESEMKNRELVAKINQFDSNNPQGAAIKASLTTAAIKRASMTICRANDVLERALAETDKGDPMQPAEAMPGMPYALKMSASLSSDEEEDFLAAGPSIESPPPTKRGRFSEGTPQWINFDPDSE